MRVLIGCEFSGTVRRAFRARGHDAWSCDLLPADDGSEFHIQGDVLHLFDKYGCPNCEGDGCERCNQWDMMIAFPPCTHLAVSGAKHFAKKRADGRQRQGIDLFMAIANAPVKRYAIENPVGIMSKVWRKPDQIIHPWQFGDEYSKTTCLWLRGLPRLSVNDPLFQEPTIVGRGEFHTCPSGKRLPKWYSSANAKTRSKTFPGIAAAMAEQWGGLE